jgi:hypothetical protein
MSLQRGINLRVLAEKMGQCSGAEVRGICTEAGACSRRSPAKTCAKRKRSCSAGMYALRERRQHVTQEDFEFAVAKVRALRFCPYGRAKRDVPAGLEEEFGGQHVGQQAVLVTAPSPAVLYFSTTRVCYPPDVCDIRLETQRVLMWREDKRGNFF